VEIYVSVFYRHSWPSVLVYSYACVCSLRNNITILSIWLIYMIQCQFWFISLILVSIQIIEFRFWLRKIHWLIERYIVINLTSHYIVFLGWLLLQTKLSVHVIYWFWLCLFCNVHPWLWFNMVNCYIILVIYVFHSKLWFYGFYFYFYKRQNQWIFVCCNLGSLVNFHDQWIQNESFILTSISPFSLLYSWWNNYSVMYGSTSLLIYGMYWS
jgi:hypothetical protein